MKSVLRTSSFFIAALGLLSNSTAKTESSDTLAGFPRVMLWAWEMPERLEFIHPEQIGVAYLDQTLYVGKHVYSRPRVQPMQVPPGTKVMAVVRVEMPGSTEVSPAASEEIVAALLRSARRPGVAALQVDFDAVKSQQRFYSEILQHVRREMPPGMPLSVTALASWCAYDRWLTSLPINEAVPMLFRMGKEQDLFRGHQPGRLVREPLCADSLGVSTDEEWPQDLRGKRIYVFNPRPWTEKSLARVLEQVKK